MKFTAVENKGGLQMTEYTREVFKQYLKNNPRCRLEITPILPESSKLRRWFEGACVPLVTYYQEGLDHRNWQDCEKVREWLKAELNGEQVVIDEKIHTVAKSTKGRPALNDFVERVVDWIEENYAPPKEALDPEKYKDWRDRIYPFGSKDDPDNYIDYLSSLNLL